MEKESSINTIFCMSLLSPFSMVRQKCASWGFPWMRCCSVLFLWRGLLPGPCALSLGHCSAWAHWAYWKLVEEPVHSPVPLTLPGDSDSRRVMLWTVTGCTLLPQCCIRIIWGGFPGSADVTVQKALLPPGGSFHSVSIPVGVPCWGPPVSQPHHSCLGQMEQVGKEKTSGLLSASPWHP